MSKKNQDNFILFSEQAEPSVSYSEPGNVFYFEENQGDEDLFSGIIKPTPTKDILPALIQPSPSLNSFKPLINRYERNLGLFEGGRSTSGLFNTIKNNSPIPASPYSVPASPYSVGRETPVTRDSSSRPVSALTIQLAQNPGAIETKKGEAILTAVPTTPLAPIMEARCYEKSFDESYHSQASIDAKTEILKNANPYGASFYESYHTPPNISNLKNESLKSFSELSNSDYWEYLESKEIVKHSNVDACSGEKVSWDFDFGPVQQELPLSKNSFYSTRTVDNESVDENDDNERSSDEFIFGSFSV